jgi:hypothetical protein
MLNPAETYRGYRLSQDRGLWRVEGPAGPVAWVGTLGAARVVVDLYADL